MHFTGTIWRPPYEAWSALMQVTEGCTHNKCKFCTLYNGVPNFRVSPVTEIEDDLRELYTAAPDVTRLFLVGANPFALSAERLKQIANLSKQYLQRLDSIGCFARITDVSSKSIGELKDLRALGFNRITIGVETGDDAALKFIFMEFFIVNHGVLWDSVLEILKEKAAQGVEVRFMYDGTCTFFRLPHNYPEYLESMGIHCRIFFPIRPALSTYQNNRDHRKIAVIDGKYAYTGGVNLADEYINKMSRFGHWKDTAVEITGEAVNTFTMLFLQNWNIQSRETEDVSLYVRDYKVKSEGYIMGYTDSPFDDIKVGESVYMDILYTATEYVHIMTPYLILDNEMITALSYAVKRGVDVKLIMPHITDKPYAYMVARNYYEILLKKGVKIYEYTPGFIHAKEFISDNKKAVVGSVNLDYRSLYLNFESAAYLYGVNAVKDAETDFLNTLNQCEEITLADCRKYSKIKKTVGKLMWLFSPLM